VSDCAVTDIANFLPEVMACAASTLRLDGFGTLIHRGLDNITVFADVSSTLGSRLAGGAGDDSIQGSSGNDYLTGGLSGGDLIDGFAGNDVIMGGAGEDLLKGGPGSDVINTGESQLGDIADGGSGVDFIHSGNSTGPAVSFIGETGDDFIQGTKNADLLLEGGDGADWVEGGSNTDLINGDLGVFGGALGSQSIFGGNDVLNGGAGNDLVNGDGGDDIINMGDGVDVVAGGPGFDFANYENMKRFDNGTAAKPSAWIELSGVNPNPTNAPQDLYAGIEGASGSSGNDRIFGSLGADFSVAGVTGTAGATFITLPGAVTTVIAGMQVTGTGIGAYALTVAPGAVVTVNGVTNTIIDLTVPNAAAVNGTIAFTTFALTAPATVTGLTQLLQGTPGWTKYSNVSPTATKWSGGSILFGGAGNNGFTLSTGSNVIHGSAQLHTCIYVVHDGSEFNTDSDVDCGAGRGYSNMTLLAKYMDAGRLLPSDLRTVKEIVGTNVTVTASSATGSVVTYTAANNFVVGDRVNVSGMSNGAFNVAGATVTAATPTTFSIALATTASAFNPEFGRAGYYNVLTVPAASTATTVTRITSGLPAGAMSGYTLTTATSTDYVYDIAAVTFSDLVTTQLAPWVGTLSALRTSTGTIAPVFNSSVTTYTVTVAAATTTATITPTATAAGQTLYVNGVVVASGAASAAVSLSTTNVTPVTVIAVSADGTSSTYYTLNFIRTGTVPTLSARTSTTAGISSSITNYNPLNTYTFTATAGAVVQGTPAGAVLPITVEGLYGGQSTTVTVTVSRPGFTTTTASFTAAAIATVLLKPLFSAPVPTTTGFTVNVINYYRPAGATTYTWSYAASTGYTAVAGTPVGSVLPITVAGPALTGMSPVLTVTTQRTGAVCPAGCGSASVTTFTTASLGIKSLMKAAPAVGVAAKTLATAKAKAAKAKAAKVKAAKAKAAKAKAAKAKTVKLKAVKPKK
jgi:Ca2+-binding RTX toxin-like protein